MTLSRPYTYNGRQYQTGEQIQVVLNNYQIFTLYDESIDFSGTKISGDKLIAVSSGYLTNGQRRVAGIDMLYPLHSYGRGYVVPLMSGGSLVVMNSNLAGTVSTYSTSANVDRQLSLLGNGGVVSATFTQPVYLYSTVPIQVMVFSVNFDSSLLLPPFEQYFRSTSIATNSPAGQVGVSLAIITRDVASLRLNGNPFNPITQVQVRGYFIVLRPVNRSERLQISSSTNQRFYTFFTTENNWMTSAHICLDDIRVSHVYLIFKQHLFNIFIVFQSVVNPPTPSTFLFL